MILDAGFEGDLRLAPLWAKKCEESGLFGGFWVAETQNDPFLTSHLALAATEQLTVGTNIAVAFARSPFVLAQTAWNLAGLHQGRFRLGLGPQVKAHVERRFSSVWPEKPAQAMQEYLSVLRHLFDCFGSGDPPRIKGTYYSCTLSSPVFTPSPHGQSHPLLGLAAVGPLMTGVGGREADMLMLHPFTHRGYLEQVTQPGLARALPARDPKLARLELVGSAFVVATDTPQTPRFLAEVRGRLAFYASTPNYALVLELLGYGELHQRLRGMAKQGDWKAMGAAIPDELLQACTVLGPREELPALLRERFSDLYHRVVVDPRQLLDDFDCE